MKFLKFENFLTENYESIMLESAFEGYDLNEAVGLTNEIDDKIKFAIVMATHKVADDIGRRSGREKYKPQLKVFKETIESIKKQNHKNWKLYLCADCYDGDEEIREILDSILDKKDYWYFNLPKPGERDNPVVQKSGASHKLCGAKAWNTALDAAKKDGVKYGIRMGHDDVWRPEHLEMHAKVHTQYPESKVVWGTTIKKRAKGEGKGSLKWPDTNVNKIEYDNLSFREGNTADVYSWEIDPFKSLKWRSTDQKSSAPRRKEWIPGDLDMWMRMNDIIKDKEYKVTFFPNSTYRYRNSKGQLP
jgi:hypothetical protein